MNIQKIEDNHNKRNTVYKHKPGKEDYILFWILAVLWVCLTLFSFVMFIMIVFIGFGIIHVLLFLSWIILLLILGYIWKNRLNGKIF